MAPIPPPVLRLMSVSTSVVIVRLALTVGRTVVIMVPLTGTPSGNTLSVTM